MKRYANTGTSSSLIGRDGNCYRSIVRTIEIRERSVDLPFRVDDLEVEALLVFFATAAFAGALALGALFLAFAAAALTDGLNKVRRVETHIGRKDTNLLLLRLGSAGLLRCSRLGSSRLLLHSSFGSSGFGRLLCLLRRHLLRRGSLSGCRLRVLPRKVSMRMKA